MGTLSLKQLKELVNEKVSLIKTLKTYSPNNRYSVGQPCFCPFHDNTDTEAAAIYQDAHTGKETLYCFAEQKQYTAVDALSSLLNYDIYEIGEQVWQGMSGVEQNNWLVSHNYIDTSSMFKVQKENSNQKEEQLATDISRFKYGQIRLTELLESFKENKGEK